MSVSDLEKRAAHKAVKKALDDGRLTRADRCERCPWNRHLVAHHSDYSRPLDVIWLCRGCHHAAHNGRSATTRLRALRVERGIRTAALAVAMDVDTTTIIRWEQAGPPRDQISTVARFFDVTGDYLMGWDTEKAA